jgi:glycosyltransferase involved in cell wall biosynthesis
MDRVAALSSGSARPLKVLLLGRTGRRKSGGIGRSAVMIANALKHVGDEARLRSVSQPLTDIPSDTDIVWHYGGFDLLTQQVEAAHECGVPIIINSTFDNTSDRRAWMIKHVEEWERNGLDKVYFVVFTESARLDPRLYRVRGRLVAMPKTIRRGIAPPFLAAPFGERKGICIGELEKLRRARLVRGMDVQAAVDALRAALPDVPLYSYNQYGTAGTLPLDGVQVVSPGEGMMHFLGNLRLFISLTAQETFSMVPCEAQGMGTPVLYRPMPQSLTEHFGMTAYSFDTVAELVVGAAKLHDDEGMWSRFSEGGLINAVARSESHVGAAMDLALRKVVFR